MVLLRVGHIRCWYDMFNRYRFDTILWCFRQTDMVGRKDGQNSCSNVALCMGRSIEIQR